MLVQQELFYPVKNLFSLTILKKARFLSSSYLSLSLYMYFQYRNCQNLLHVQNVFITKRHCMTLMSTKQRQRPPLSLSFNIFFKESLLTFATSSVKRGQPVTSTFCIRVVGANSRIYTPISAQRRQFLKTKYLNKNTYNMKRFSLLKISY